MSLIVKQEARVFIYREAIDMRAGFGRLLGLITEAMKANLFEGSLFVFDGTGLVLITKRLDRGSFMPVADLCETGEISQDELKRLLDGANLRVVFAARKRARAGQEVA